MRGGQGIGKAGWGGVTVVLFAGLSVFFVVMVHGVYAGQGSLYRIAAPGEASVELHRAGHYTIYLEYSRTVDSLRINRPKGIEDLQIDMINIDGGPVAMQPAPPDQYAIRRLVGEAFRTFYIEVPATFPLHAYYPAGNGPPLDLVFKRSYREQVVETLAKGLLVLILTTTAVGTLLWWLHRRALGRQDREFTL